MPTIQETKIERNTPLIERNTLSEGIVQAFINNRTEVWEALKIIGDLRVDKDDNILTDNKGNIILGPNRMVNAKGFRRIITLLRTTSTKDVGIGFRNEERIMTQMRYKSKEFINNLEDNIENWEVEFKDCLTLIQIFESLAESVLSKSYKGLQTKQIAGTMQSKETSNIEQNKGLKGMFGIGKKGGDE